MSKPSRFSSRREKSELQSVQPAITAAKKGWLATLICGLAVLSGSATATIPIADEPLFAVADIPPHVMINMSVDNQLFASAFPEFADLNGDGAPDRGYVHEVDYFGYFDSYKCYSYSTSSNRFQPVSETANKYCSGENWSGNFLNWVTMSRIDTVRQILYGGKRSTDTTTLTVLERSYLPTDAHSWVKFYDGSDLELLTPFSALPATTVNSTSSVAIARPPAGERNADTHRRTFIVPGWTTANVQLGDQVEIRLQSDPQTWMRGVVRSSSLGTNPRTINVQITSFNDPSNLTGQQGPWTITNHSRRGVSFCNTTVTTGASHGATAIAAPPLMRVARGDYSLWTANERWQCQWSEERNRHGDARMAVGGLNFSNGNDISASGLWANSDNPVRDVIGLGAFNYRVRVEVCRAGLIGTERCQAYGPNEILKPIGLLQEFGEDGRIRFGLMTGSYTRHVAGGVLRKNMGTFSDEVNLDTGQFLLPTDSMVRSLDALRIFGYSHDSGDYTADAENCVFGTSKALMIGGRCFSWGNPQAEIFAESLRYLAGLDPNPAFTHTGNDRIPGLTAAAWNNPVTEDLWCTPKSIIQFNASVTSYDDGAAAAAVGLPGFGNMDTWTNLVGTGEGLAGASVFQGGSTGFCTAETIGNLAAFRGICPEAPNQDGTYHIAGLAHYAYTTDLRPTWTGQQTVRTIGVSLAPAVPRIDIPRPGQTQPSILILPACDNRGDNLRCALADFRIIDQDLAAGTGSFFIQWDVAEWGADFDSDLNGILRYAIVGDEVRVTTQMWGISSARSTGFGYIISGTNNDGFHAHSGINSYARNNPGANVPNCVSCNVGDPPTTARFQIGAGTARLLREPLFYAAKWGGYDKTGNFPTDPLSWDSDGDGLPDNYFFAIDPAELLAALRASFLQILADVAVVAEAPSTNRLDEGEVSYQAGLDPNDWTGDMIAIDVGAEPPVIKWQASSPAVNQPANRRIFIGNGTGAEEFDTTNLSGLVRDRLMSGVVALQLSPGCGGAESENWYCGLDSDQLIDFLRGVPPSELDHPNALRERSSFIGTVVNSDTVLNIRQVLVDEGWGSLGGEVGEDYFEFVDAKIADLGDPTDPSNPSKAVVMVGSNAGMLHAFSVESGREVFSYIPSMIIERLHRQADPNFQPEPLVDGRFAVADAYFGERWRRVLVGALGGGGKGLYALDITNPETFGANNVLWELTPDDLGAENLGHVFSAPVITRLADGRFVTIFGNGVNGADEVPELFVVDLETGSVIDSMRPTVGNDSRTASNGLMGVGIALSRLDSTHVGRVYAGDLNGRLWRFRMDEDEIGDFTLFFEAPDTQPMTAPPTVAVSVQGGWEIYFGTGRFFAEGDNIVDSENEPLQSFYLVRDTDQDDTRRPADLGRAVISGETSVAGLPSRTVGATAFNRLGWALDFTNPAGGRSGERVRDRANIGFGAVIFTSYQPVEDICQGGGLNRIYVLDQVTGEGLLSGPGVEGQDPAASVEIPGNAPLAPPILIRNVQTTPDDASDPEIPVDPGAPLPTLPVADGLDRTAWCSQFGVRLQGVGFQPLGTVCDGRQIWRQIR